MSTWDAKYKVMSMKYEIQYLTHHQIGAFLVMGIDGEPAAKYIYISQSEEQTLHYEHLDDCNT